MRISKMLVAVATAGALIAPAALAEAGQKDQFAYYATASPPSAPFNELSLGAARTFGLQIRLDRIDKLSAAPEVRRPGDLAGGTQHIARSNIGVGCSDINMVTSGVGKTQTGLAYNLSA